jgi:hypothetical protein
VNPNRTLNVYRDGRGLSFWPSAAGDGPAFRALVAGELLRCDESGRALIRFRRRGRGVVAIGPVALVRLARAGLPGFRAWEDRLPPDLSPFEPPARRRRPPGPWAIFLVPARPGRPSRCVSTRAGGRGRTTFGARYTLRFPRRAEALAWLEDLRAEGLRRRGYRYLVDRL